MDWYAINVTLLRATVDPQVFPRFPLKPARHELATTCNSLTIHHAGSLSPPPPPPPPCLDLAIHRIDLFYRVKSHQPAEADTHTYDVVGDQGHVYDGKEDVYYSTVTAPPTSTGEGKGFTLSECPAYGQVAPRGEKGGHQPAEYEVVQTTSTV